MRNVFDVLLAKSICFSVVVALTTFRVRSVQDHNVDYFIIIHETDKPVLKGYKFYLSDNYNRVYEYTLSKKEIDFFKNNVNMFKKIIHDKNGRVYELKNNSFKDKYGHILRKPKQTTI